MPIRHIVLINWKSEVSQDLIGDWIKTCNRIPDECPMVHNWSSGLCISGPDPDKPSSHQFAIVFDLNSNDEWMQYLKHPYPGLVYDTGMKVIDLDRTASTNMLLETKPAAS
ncbi:MAG: Dabb family protein [Pyrinomonadaceae bacterium]